MAKTVLTIDDSPSIRQLVSFTLELAGYQVLTAADGAGGLRVMQNQAVDLVITDQNMAGMNGLAFIKAVRALPQFRNTPVLMLTTEAGEEMKSQARAAGASGWLVKPFDPQKLHDIIKKLLV